MTPAGGVTPPIGGIVELASGGAVMPGIGAIVGLEVDVGVTLGVAGFVVRGVGGFVIPGIGAIVEIAAGARACAESGRPKQTKLKPKPASSEVNRIVLNILRPVVCFARAISS